MSEKDRAAFVLFDLEELSAPEIARELGLSESAVMSRVRRARAVLERVLERKRRLERSHPDRDPVRELVEQARELRRSEQPPAELFATTLARLAREERARKSLPSTGLSKRFALVECVARRAAPALAALFPTAGARPRPDAHRHRELAGSSSYRNRWSARRTRRGVRSRARNETPGSARHRARRRRAICRTCRSPARSSRAATPYPHRYFHCTNRAGARRRRSLRLYLSCGKCSTPGPGDRVAPGTDRSRCYQGAGKPYRGSRGEERYARSSGPRRTRQLARRQVRPKEERRQEKNRLQGAAPKSRHHRPRPIVSPVSTSMPRASSA
jgi:predicted DNA-binding protein YlxM (UPF0122 family)